MIYNLTESDCCDSTKYEKILIFSQLAANVHVMTFQNHI